MNILRAYKALGVVFLALLLLGVWFTYAVFTKKFTDYDEVRLQTSKIGLQLPARADVKIRGVLVGEVTDIETDGDGAVLTLGIDPSQLGDIPANVTGSIVPKTLFGEKYVSLLVPDQPAGPIRPGATIERASVATEVEQVLNDLYPLLRAVQPAEINKTLSALATALEGRGDQLGQNLETVDSYLKRFNPRIPDLVEDLRLTSKVSDIYSDVLPQVAAILRNTITTTGTLEGREEKLQTLFDDVAAFSGTTQRFLENNGDNIVRLGDLSAAQLRVLAKYAPEYPCLLGGIVKAGGLQAQAFRGFTLHINLELLPNQPRGYNAADQPVYGDKGGPYCGALPDPGYNQQNLAPAPRNFADGVDRGTGKGTSRVAPSYAGGGAATWTGEGYVGSPAETGVLKELIGPALGTTGDHVPDLGPLLVGPMARGGEVSLR